MKTFLIAVVCAGLIALGAGYTLKCYDRSSQTVYSSNSVRF